MRYSLNQCQVCVSEKMPKQTENVAKNQMVTNFMFDFMDLDESHPECGKCYLVNIAVADAANANNMASFFKDSLFLL